MYIQMLWTSLLNLVEMLRDLLRYYYINFVRVGLGKADQSTLDSLRILHKSKDFLVVNKEPDLYLINEHRKSWLASLFSDRCVSLEEQVHKRFPEIKESQGPMFPHRLDYATSGAICLAVNKNACRWAGKSLEKRYVTKHYVALVRGTVPLEAAKGAEIQKAIGRHKDCLNAKDKPLLMCVSDDPACVKPRPAWTTLYLLEHGTYFGNPASKVLLVAHTGRSHQLRVHCKDYGHLIVGDYTYSNRQDIRPRRMMLHAFRLVIPMLRETIDVTAPDPFVPDTEPGWEPSRVVRTYSDFLEENPIVIPDSGSTKVRCKYGKKYRHLEGGASSAGNDEHLKQRASRR